MSTKAIIILVGLFVIVSADSYAQRMERNQEHFQVLLFTKYRAQGIGDLRRDKSRDGYLIQQRLEEVVVVFVDQRDLHWRFCEPARDFHSAEPRADDNNVGESFTVHVLFPSFL